MSSISICVSTKRRNRVFVYSIDSWNPSSKIPFPKN